MAPAPDAPLIFPASKKPVVSIVIPVYNEWVITHRCLWSILQHTEGEYEVIVADDCSTDETVNIATYVHGVHVVRSIQCNRGDTGSHFKIQRLVTHSSFLLDSVVFLLAEI